MPSPSSKHDPGDLVKFMRAVMKRHPMLTEDGFGLCGVRRRGVEHTEAFHRAREALLKPDSLDAFGAAMRWLSGRRHLARLWSYGYKAEAEQSIGYITNGCFIAAAAALGWKIVRDDDGVNAWLLPPDHLRKLPSTARRPRLEPARSDRRVGGRGPQPARVAATGRGPSEEVLRSHSRPVTPRHPARDGQG